jgi:hypothetical protein
VALVAEHLPNKYKALSSNPNATKKFIEMENRLLAAIG